MVEGEGRVHHILAGDAIEVEKSVSSRILVIRHPTSDTQLVYTLLFDMFYSGTWFVLSKGLPKP